MVSGVSLWKCTSTAARLLAMISSRVRSACDVTITSLSCPAARLSDICDNSNAGKTPALAAGVWVHRCGRPPPVSLISVRKQLESEATGGANCDGGCPPHRIAVGGWPGHDRAAPVYPVRRAGAGPRVLVA